MVRWGFPNSWGFPQVSAASRAYTVHLRNFAYRKQRLFCFRSSNGRKMHADSVIVDRQSVECERQAHSSRNILAWPCTIRYNQFWAVHCEPKCRAVLISLFIFFGLMCNFFFENRMMIKLRTIRRNLWHGDSKNTAKTGCRGRFRKSEHGACIQHALVIRWTEIKTWYHEASNFRFPTLNPKLATGQRRKWRLVCEWVCTVASVSVRIKKRANCAKNNRPKSGWLFLVNTRPFPEQSSSIATCRVGSI